MNHYTTRHAANDTLVSFLAHHGEEMRPNIDLQKLQQQAGQQIEAITLGYKVIETVTAVAQTNMNLDPRTPITVGKAYDVVIFGHMVYDPVNQRFDTLVGYLVTADNGNWFCFDQNIFSTDWKQ